MSGPNQALNAEGAEDAEENQKRGKAKYRGKNGKQFANSWRQYRLRCITSPTAFTSSIFFLLPFLRVLCVLRGQRLNYLGAGPGVHVILVPVAVAMFVHFHRHHVEPPVTDLALGHQLVGEFAHFSGRATEYDGFQAIVVVEVHVHR